MNTASNIAPTKFSPALALAQWEAAGRPDFWLNIVEFPCGTALCAETGTVIGELVDVNAQLDWSQAVWG
jgi:hypothetical protein